MLTVSEAAKIIGLTPKTIRRYIRDGRLPAIKEVGPSGNMYKVAIEDLERLVLEMPLAMEGARETASSRENTESLTPVEPIPQETERVVPDPAPEPIESMEPPKDLVTIPLDVWERHQEIYSQSMETIGQLQGQLEQLNAELERKEKEVLQRQRDLNKLQMQVGQASVVNSILPLLEEHRKHLKEVAISLETQDKKHTEFAKKTLSQLAKGEAQQLELSKEILTRMEARDREFVQIIRAWREEREKKTEVKAGWWTKFWGSDPKHALPKPNRRVKVLR